MESQLIDHGSFAYNNHRGKHVLPTPIISMHVHAFRPSIVHYRDMALTVVHEHFSVRVFSTLQRNAGRATFHIRLQPSGMKHVKDTWLVTNGLC